MSKRVDARAHASSPVSQTATAISARNRLTRARTRACDDRKSASCNCKKSEWKKNCGRCDEQKIVCKARLLTSCGASATLQRRLAALGDGVSSALRRAIGRAEEARSSPSATRAAGEAAAAAAAAQRYASNAASKWTRAAAPRPAATQRRFRPSRSRPARPCA